MVDERCLDLARRVHTICRARGVLVATAESCTGGLIAACLSEHAGASEVLDRGFVTYSNDAKELLLAVRGTSLAEHGAVSERVAREMAEGALARSKAVFAVAVTGIAGPDGGTAAKPVGLVHIAVAAGDGSTVHERHVFTGGRRAIRAASVSAALDLLLRQAGEPRPA